MTRHASRAVLLALALWAAPALATVDGAPDRPGHGHALLIATDRYDHWSDLVNPVRDMWALAGELEEGYGFAVETLENPTGREIEQKLQEYVNRSFGEDDQLVVYFAGHGVNDEYRDDDSYLVTRDSSPPEDENFNSYLSFTRLLGLTSKTTAKNVLVIADTCFIKAGQPVGTGALTARPTAELLRRAGQFRTRLLLTAGASELVSDGVRGEHSPLMRQLLEGLRTYGGSAGVLPLNRLVNVYLRRVRPQRPQLLQFDGHQPGGTFLFVPLSKLSEAAPEAAPARTYLSSTGTASARTPLRPRPGAFSADQVKRFFRSRRLRDASFNPGGDFPNELTVKTLGHDEVILDRASNLVWQVSGSPYRLGWDEVEGYVAETNRAGHAGFRDWRLPTLEEMGSLIEPRANRRGLFLHPAFDPEQVECWTTDLDPENRTHWYVRFNEGHTRSFSRDPRFFVRLVRANVRAR